MKTGNEDEHEDNESAKERSKRLDKLLFPYCEEDDFNIDMTWHMARVRSAVRFLDTAKINNLRKPYCAKMVKSAHKAWSRQVERVLDPDHGE